MLGDSYKPGKRDKSQALYPKSLWERALSPSMRLQTRCCLPPIHHCYLWNFAPAAPTPAPIFEWHDSKSRVSAFTSGNSSPDSQENPPEQPCLFLVCLSTRLPSPDLTGFLASLSPSQLYGPGLGWWYSFSKELRTRGKGPKQGQGLF